jgi:hypothetical protein
MDIASTWYQQFSGEEGVVSEKLVNAFRTLARQLPKLLDTYVTKKLGSKYTPLSFVEIIRTMGKSDEAKKELVPQGRLQPAMASVKVADDFPINHDISASPPPSSGSGDSGSGGGGLNLPSMGEAGGEAEGVGALEELAPLALAASKKAQQWEVPTCKSCGKTNDAKECPACNSHFCADCTINHHANNPSHDRVASKSAAPMMDTEDRAWHDNDTSLDLKNIIEDVMGNGLYSADDNAHFTWKGCDYCNTDGLPEGADVYTCHGFRNITDAKSPNRDDLEYDFNLCGDCLNKLGGYGE